MNATKFYIKLENSLPKSTAYDRKIWAHKIVQEELNLKGFSKLLWCEKIVASRFLWLLSEVGELNPNMLLLELPYLLKLSNHIDIKHSFATFWLISGIPQKNEALAIDMLFNWIRSSDVNVTTKSRSLFVLFNLTIKYPDLKNELRLCLEDQMDRNTKDFRTRAMKILKKLEI